MQIIANPTASAPEVNTDAEKSGSSMDSNLGVLTGSPRPTGDADEAIWINGRRVGNGLPSDGFGGLFSMPPSMPSSPLLSNISTPLLSNLSSTIPSRAASLLRQTIERPLSASLPCKPEDGSTMASPDGRADNGRRFKYTPPKYCFIAVFVALFFASAFALIPALSRDIDRGLFVDFSTMLEVQGRVANTFIGGKTAGTELAKQITRAELATRDLIVAIRFSDIQSGDILADELSVFVRDASDTAELLLALDAKAMGTVESLIYIDEHMLRAIGKASQHKPGLVSGLIRKTPMDIVTRNFMELMAIESKALFDLIELATDANARLRRIKERLQAIRDLTYVEGAALNESQGVLSYIWARLSSDRAEPKTFRTNLELLTALDGYTEDARTHVEQALFNLRAMQGQLKDLRERTVQAPIIGNLLPIESHVMALDQGLQRVKTLVQRGENYQVGK